MAATAPSTLLDLLATGRDGDPAVLAPDRPPLCFAGLRALVREVAGALRARGIGPEDRVAIVLPNGPEAATSFLTVACAAATAPLNPAYREEELDFYLEDLKAKAVLVTAEERGPAVTVAERRGLQLLRLLVPAGAEAGRFSLGAAQPTDATPAPEATALLLHTSGTTSRPKLVPLSHANLAASARHIGTALALSPADRCLNIMPLFHIHGLVAAVLSSLAAGGSVFCTPGFNALRFFSWLEEAQPSWYTAVPTMHQAILARAERNPEILARTRLRLIRSSSASLPPQVMRALEEVFGCPVIESYGMTEASHQMTSNPLPPRPRKPGSVGVPAGPLVRIADPSAPVLLEGDVEGEVVISGPNVTRGYEANPEANAKSFFEAEGRRWFRTGDQGRFDADGYLRITGRLKEIINRGGEKVSPLEVDEVLMDHPAVAQCVTFAIPHEKLGEEVGAAVVLREGTSASEQEIRAFAATRLADFKVPRKIVILAEIPKGATGKLQRIGLAQRLGLA
ncbi:MAG: acyl--CoA ligase [Geminicoccaceae bacterium]|nr:acyl--CoA ligase [Geminicoccaceae bacterium]MCX8100291.1 acyl--CoA ligase [Geminicoccaceae bacterium]MDW8370325.1 acyl--CoA ligase [Geminicoccaceae bacterium]